MRIMRVMSVIRRTVCELFIGACGWLGFSIVIYWDSWGYFLGFLGWLGFRRLNVGVMRGIRDITLSLFPLTFPL